MERNAQKQKKSAAPIVLMIFSILAVILSAPVPILGILAGIGFLVPLIVLCAKKNRVAISIIGICLSSLAIIIAIASLSGDSGQMSGQISSTSTARATATPVPVIEISAEDLISAYDKNEVSADNRYKGKKLQITGIIKSIGKDLFDNPYVVVDSGADFNIISIQCYFSSTDEKNKIAELSKGNAIIITGTCKGLFLNISMRNCTIE
jgi:hypothetical protein